jgi:hypothetical protein
VWLARTPLITGLGWGNKRLAMNPRRGMRQLLIKNQRQPAHTASNNISWHTPMWLDSLG